MKGNIYPRSHRLQSLVHLLIVLMLDCVGARCTSFKCHFIIELYKKIIIKLLIIIITRACIMIKVWKIMIPPSMYFFFTGSQGLPGNQINLFVVKSLLKVIFRLLSIKSWECFLSWPIVL